MHDWHQEHSTMLLLLSSHLVPLADTIGAGKGLGAIKVESVLLGEMSQCGLTPVKAVSAQQMAGWHREALLSAAEQAQISAMGCPSPALRSA